MKDVLADGDEESEHLYGTSMKRLLELLFSTTAKAIEYCLL
jgi:hypothetical protein